jgi:3-hydroxyacyl-[acyl-carrier-protein] dehydratase
MRWFWIDRFTEFESGRCATAVKNVSLAEDYLHDHFAGQAVMPNTLIIEGLAQTGGLLVGEKNEFKERVVLAKLSSAKFSRPAFPGDQLTYRAVVEDIREDGALVHCTSHVGEQLQAEVEMFFAHLDARQDQSLFEPADFLAMLKMLRLYEVGKLADGRPLPVPAHLAAAEAAGAATSFLPRGPQLAAPHASPRNAP